MYLIKIDGQNPSKSNEVSISDAEVGQAITPTTHGFAIVGRSDDPDSDIYLVLTDSKGGNPMGKRLFKSGSEEHGSDIIQAKNGDLVGVGLTTEAGNTQVFIFRTDQFGGNYRYKSIGAAAEDRGYSIRETPDGGFIIGGNTKNYGSAEYDFYFIKVSADFEPVWNTPYTFGSADYDYIRGMISVGDGSFVAVGHSGESNPPGRGWEIMAVKIDDDKNIIWGPYYYGTAGDENANAIVKTPDGGYLIVGETKGKGNGWEIFTLKIDAAGQQMGELTTIGGGPKDDWGSAIIRTPDGAYAIAGDTENLGSAPLGNSNAYFIKIKCE